MRGRESLNGRKASLPNQLGRVTHEYLHTPRPFTNPSDVMSYLTRSLVSATYLFTPQPSLIRATISTWHASRSFNSTAFIRKNIDFVQKQGSEIETTSKGEVTAENQQLEKVEKKSKKHAGKTSSLRRVAVEAQRSRQGFVKGRGNKRFVDPQVDTKVCHSHLGRPIDV